MMRFTRFHLMFHTIRVQETYTVHTQRSPCLLLWRQLRQHVVGSHQAALQMPNSRGCDDFFERLQIVLFALRDRELNAVYNATADV